MDQKVWQVQLGRVYRPVFEAEEMLVRSLKKSQKTILPSVKSSQSSDFHESVTEERTDDQLVYHLPDRLPAIQKGEKSERLRNLEERRKSRHERIVEKMKNSISETIKKFHQQFEEISKELLLNY